MMRYLDGESSPAEAASFEARLDASTELMTVMARACGHRRLADFELADLTTFDKSISDLAGVAFGGVAPER